MSLDMDLLIARTAWRARSSVANGAASVPELLSSPSGDGATKKAVPSAGDGVRAGAGFGDWFGAGVGDGPGAGAGDGFGAGDGDGDWVGVGSGVEC